MTAALREWLVAVAATPPGAPAGRIEVHAVYATDERAALAACTDPARSAVARRAVPLDGIVRALWNELGRAAFGFGA
jgi:hypothetical protein